MLEIIEFRVPEEKAAATLPAGLGVVDVNTRRIRVASGDPLVELMSQTQRDFELAGDTFVLGWDIRRKYTPDELKGAPLLQVLPRKVFEPAGEECGTAYDETTACRHVFEPARTCEVSTLVLTIPPSSCGAGARQITPLCLDARRIPKKADVAVTIADECVVTKKVVDVFQKYSVTGATCEPIQISRQRGAASKEHFQLIASEPFADIADTTRAGKDVFDAGSYGRCPSGHVIGLNLLSEVVVRENTLSDHDLLWTRQMVGVRRGLLRPRRLLLISQRLFRIFEREQVKGLSVEVVRLNDSH